MEHLTILDIRTLLAVLGEIAALRQIETFPEQVMAVVSRLVAADSITYNEVNPVRRRVVSTIRPTMNIPSDALDYLAKHLEQHPVIDYFRQSGWGRPLKISDFLSQQELHRRGIYAVVYGPVRTEDQLSFTLPAHSPTMVGIALNRSSRSFDERDRLLLDLIRPHLTEAYRTADLLGRYTTAFDLAEVGRMTLDGCNHILHMNDRARTCLDRYFQATEPKSVDLPESLAAWVQVQQRLRKMTDDVAPPVSPLEIASESGRLTIRFVRGDEWGNGAMLLFTERRQQPEDEQLRALGLSQREIQVLRCIERGQSDHEIAKELGVSPGTVKKHVEHVYRKLKVTSRTAAIARIRSSK